ncbi:ESPR-type extended signal peptide-containing protein [Acinetobacter baumannii]|uniref:ESPR-type extended signal peptide-containing protein n=3 Tax=Acinetobacter baumannii TaxID=470 RepID=UPI00295897A6|nr:ESPR-type extended signal peptide-containing protein [Acinetobacter baumannii]WNX69696.1 ESPR-type extended signal peptide-containing protein [Acinetobacter baumannii]
MNKIYKVIWNASLGIWVAVSEIAKGHSKTRSQRTDDALVPSTEVLNSNVIIDPPSLSAPLLFRIKPLTWGILTVLVPSITFGAVGTNGGALGPNGTTNSTAISACTGTTSGATTGQAYAGGDRSLALGCGAVTDSDRDIAIGSQASTANPANATGTYNESIAIGAESRASGSQALAIGGQATATGNSSVAIGADDMDKVASTNPPAFNYTPAAGDNALYNNTATAAAYKNLTGDYLVDFEKTNGGASGVGNRYTRVQTGEAAVAIGPKATATDLGTALGPVATAGSVASVALGVKADAEGQGSLSIGSLAYTGSTGAVAVGINSAATANNAIAIGAGSDLKSTAYVQSGASASKKGASASGVNSISIGSNTAATGTNAVVVGQQSTASNLAVAVGSVATAGDQSISIGSNSAASSQTSVAIGAGAQATLQNNSVALGSGSVADRASGSLGYDPLTETSTTNTNSTWKATDAAVSVGNGTTRTRQITSVAAGTNDTDAANVAQLKKATSKVLAGTGTTVAQGTDSNGITTYTVNANTFTVRQGTTNKATIGDSTTDKVSFINGKNTVAKVADELNSNTDVTFDLADDITLNSVTTGNTTLNSSGVTVNGGTNGPVKLTNTGLDNGGNKITNVAAGTVSSTSTDAVNGSQLNTTNQNVTTAQNTANTAVTNAAAAQATADKGLNFSVNGGTADNVKLGETVNFADGTNTTAVYDPATNTYKYNVNDNIALTNAGSLTVGNTKVDNSGLTITGGPSVTTTGINAGNQKITNVAAGTISSTSTDAVNGSQLNTTNQNVTTAQNTANTAVTNAAAAQATADKGLNFSVNGGAADNVKLGETVNFADGTNTTAVYDPATNTYKYNVNDNIGLTSAGSLTVGNTKVDNSGLTITGGPSVTTAGINAGNQKVTNVAAGTISSTSTDAVNGSQLDATNQNVTTAQNTANAANTTANKGLNFSVNNGTADNVQLGETVNFADGTNTTAVYDPATNTYKYNVNDNIALTSAGSLTVGNTKVDNSGLTITGGPSVTTAGINAGNQKVTNVAAGTISSTSTDAVNGSQLNATNQNVTTAQNTANAANTTANKGLNFSVNNGTADNVQLGETVNFADGTNTTAVYDPATNTYKYNVNDNIALTNAGSLTVGNTKVDNSGLTITGGPSVTTAGINAGNQKVTNVAAGTISSTSTDAVNGSQLDATNQNVTAAQNTANTAVTNAAAAQATADKGLNFSVNGGTADNVKLGETVNFADGTNTTAVYDPATNTYKYNVNDNIALTNAGSLTVGNTKVDNSGLTITGGPSVTTAGINAGNQKVTNVAAGTISSTSTDAVNGSQLNATNQNVTAAQNTANTAVTNAAAAQATADKGLNFSVNGGTADNVKLGETVNFADGTNTTAVYDPATNTYKYNVNDNIGLTSAGSLTVGNTKVDNSGLTITGGPSVTTAGINAGNQKVTNVAAGTVSSTSTDAVNGSQLDATNQNVTAAQNTANTAVINAAAAQATADKGLNFSVNGGTADNVKLGETVNFADGTNTTAVYDPATNTYKYNVNDNIGLTSAGSLTVGNTKVDNSGLTITGGPSVTTAGINAGNQKVTNVAAGTISSTSTDAVNGSQLDATNQNVTAAQNTANTAVTNAAAAQATADKGLNFSVNGGAAKNVKLGETVNFADGTNTTATYDPATNTYKYSVNDNIGLTNAGSLTVGNTKVDNSGLTITGGPSVTTAGIDAANQKITNVAAGTNPTDAVNVSQLGAATTAANTKTDALGTSTANNLGGGAVYNPVTGAVSSPVYSVNGNNVNNVGDAITALDKGWTLQSNGANAGAVKAGDTVDIGTVAGETNLKVTKTGNNIQYGLNRDLNVDSVTAGDSKLDTNGLTIAGGPSVTKSGINAANQKITNVAAGTISSTSTDAVNGSQLNATNQNVTTAQNTANTAVTNAAAAQATADKGLNFSVNGGAAKNVKLGETVNFADGTNTTATYDPATNTYKYSVNDNIGLTNAGSLTVGNTKVDNSGLTITGGPSVTTAGIDAANQKVTNVAAGTISSTSTDAVNGSQLDATNQNVTTAQNTANTAVTNAAAAQATADKGLNFSVNGGTADNMKLGETVNFADGTNTTAVYDPATNTYKYNVNDNIALTNAGSLTVGNTKVDNSGLTITGGPSVTTAGIDAGNQKITNVAAGTNATDAVNVSQLGAVTTAANTKTDALGTSTASNLGGGAVYNPVTGAVSSPVYSVNGNNVNNVGDAITALDKGWTLQSNGANAGAVKAGDTVDIGTLAGETNLKVTKTGNNIQYGLNRDLNIDSVTAGDSKLDTNGLTIAGGPSVTKSGINAANQKVTNVAAGTISSTSTDAVNGSQLNATNQNVTTAQNTANTAVTNAAAAQATADKGLNFSVNGGAAKNVKLGETVNFSDGTNTTATYDPTTNTYKYSVNDNIALTNAGSLKVGNTKVDNSGLTVGNTKVDNSGLTITGGPSVTTAGINAGNQKITNVAAGTNPTDAVNVSQLGAATTAANTKTDALGTSTANNLGGGAVYNPVTGAVSSPIYTVNGNNVNNVGAAISALDKGWTLQSNGANAGAVKAGDTVDIGTATGETNLTVTKSGNTIQYGLNRNLNIDSVTAGDSKLDTNGLTIAGGPSVTKSGIDAANQKITNVAAGTISATSTDAVNGSQLHTIDSRVTKNGDSTANIFGGGAKANPDGSISNPTYNVAGTSANNVGDALTALDKAVTDAGTAANAGWTVSANGDTATAKKIKPNGKVNFTGDDNLTVAQSSETDNEGNIKVALNKNLKVDSVTAGNTVIDTTGVKVGDNVQLGATGLTIVGGPSITTSGISAGNKVITNVAAGVNTTDAVNKGQLDSAITNINNNVGTLANSAVQYDKNADGTVNKDSVTFAGGANGTALKNVANGTVAAGSKDAVNGGQLWNVQQQVDKNTGDISNLQNNINNGKTGLVQQADKDAAITVGKDTGGTQVNVAGTAGDRTVTGVKAGAITTTSKDAVNGSQLNTTNQALVSALGGGAGYNNITESFSNPTYNVGDKSYHNVGDAIGALNQADQTLNTKIDNVSNKLEQAFYATNQRIDDVEKKANAGIAAAMALENAPFVAGKYTYAVGAAYHGGENAVGVTLRKTADNGRWSLTGGVAAASQGDPSVRIGISGVID